MPRYKRRTRMPNRYGSICHLSGNRRRPYAVYPPVTKYSEKGVPIRPKAIGYAETYNDALELLVMYNRGLVLPAVELVPRRGPTFAEVYEKYYDNKYNGVKKLGQQSMDSTRAAFKNSSALHDLEFTSITYAQLQAVVDDCPLKHASLENIRTLFKGMYAYAVKYGLAEKDPSRYVEIKIPDDDEHGIPFTDEEISILWNHKGDLIAQILLVMIYSGFRLSAFKSLKTVLKPDWFFQGGLKTKAGKGRIVPVHSGIQTITAGLIKAYGCIIPWGNTAFRNKVRAYLPSIGIGTDHTPHDCRHTFSYLCEKYRVPENDRKRLLGHAFKDVTNSVYGHRTLEQLRESIEMIKIE